MRNSMQGVTLVELMVVVVIVAVLMSVAIPSYRQYTMRANRAEGQSFLLQAAANQERFFLTRNQYTDNLTDAPPDGLGMEESSPSGHYNFTLNIQNGGTAFTAVATAAGGQADDTDCDVLAINERGQRYGGPGPAFDDGSNDLDKCW